MEAIVQLCRMMVLFLEHADLEERVSVLLNAKAMMESDLKVLQLFLGVREHVLTAGEMLLITTWGIGKLGDRSEAACSGAARDPTSPRGPLEWASLGFDIVCDSSRQGHRNRRDDSTPSFIIVES